MDDQQSDTETEISDLKKKLTNTKKRENSLRQSLIKASMKLADYETAYHFINKALKRDPYNESLILKLGKMEKVADKKKEYNFTQEHLEYLGSLPEDERKNAALAALHFITSDCPKACDIYKKKPQISDDDIIHQYQYATCCHSIGKFSEAEELYKKVISQDSHKCSESIEQLASLYAQIGEYEKAKAFLIDEMEVHQNAPEARPLFNIYQNLGNLEKAWQLFPRKPHLDSVDMFFNGAEYFQTKLAMNETMQKVVILAQGGIGDELQLTNLYAELQNLISDQLEEIIISCDYRIQKMLERAFPEIQFVPVQRSYQEQTDDKTNTPEPLKLFMNDDIIRESKGADAVLLSYSLPSIFRGSYEAFEEAKHIPLKALDHLKAEWQTKLSELGYGLKIGICKGSHMGAYNRSLNVVGYEKWSEIFDLDAQFIDLSFDTSEHKNVHKFTDIDLKNDIENLSALISELDLVITPPNMMTDLAGCLGTKTFVLYTTKDYDWRYVGENKADIWHSCVYGISCKEPGDKAAVMQNLKQAIEEEISDYSLSNKVQTSA